MTITGRSADQQRRAVAVVGLVLVVALGAIAIGGAILWRQLSIVRTSLEEARLTFTQLAAGEDLADGGTVASQLEVGRRAVDRAGRALDHPVVDLAGRVPVLGRTIGATGALVDVADATVATADHLLTSTGLTAESFVQGLVTDDGGVAIEQVVELGRALDDAPVGDLLAAGDRLAELGTRWLPDEVAAARVETLAHVARIRELVDRADELLAVLPDLLGADQPRRYLVLMQNSAELRGTGGLPGFWAEVTIDGGAFELGEPIQYTELIDDEFAFPDAVDPREDFVDRYAHVAATSFPGNVNVDPDLPTTGPVVLDLYAGRTGQRLDGVIVLDPLALEAVMAATGPVELPADVVSGGAPRVLDADNVVSTLLVDAYTAFEGRVPARKDYLAAVAEASFRTLFGRGFEDAEVLRALVEATEGRHLQFYSAIDEAQAVLEGLGVAGAMGADGDMLAVTANNAGANKQDVHVRHRISGQLELALDPGATAADGQVAGERRAHLRVGVVNPLTGEELTPYVVGSAPADGRDYAGQTGQLGLNRTWFTVWSPRDSRVTGARAHDGEPLQLVTDRIHGHLAADRYLRTPPASSRHFEVDVATPVQLTRRGDQLVYELTWWRQAKAIPDEVSLRLAPPAGWRVVDGTLHGGEGGSSFEGELVDEDTPEGAGLALEGDGAFLQGALTRDATIELVLERAPSGPLGWFGLGIAAPTIGSSPN